MIECSQTACIKANHRNNFQEDLRNFSHPVADAHSRLFN